MRFLIKMAFWLSVVLALLPTFAGTSQNTTTAAQSGVDAGDAVSAASATVSDLSGFCDRQPEACNIGAQVAVAFGHQAQAGAKIVYDYLNDRASPKATGSVTTGTAAAKSKDGKPAVRKASFEASGRDAEAGDTLTAEDLAPAWRGPAPRKPQGRHAS